MELINIPIDMITNHRTSSLRRILSSIACGILLTAFTGCGNDRSTPLDDDLPSVGDLVEINILTNGIESFADAEEVATRSALAGGTEGEQTVHTQVQPLEDGRLLVATVKASKATRGAAASSTGTRAIPLTNTTLRVLAYDSDGKYVDECMYDVDGSGNATVKSGQSLVVPARVTPYTFYCYSSGLCYINTETKEVSVGATDFFAFGTQEVVINGSSNTQTVAFPTLALKVAMIKLKVTSNSDASAAVSYTATLTGGNFANSGATFRLTSGAYSGFGTSVQSKSFDANDTEIIIPPSGGTGDMTLTLSDLVVDGTALSSLPSLPITIPTIVLAAGTKYTLDIKVNAVLSKAPFVILPSIGLRVAKGNLMRASGTVGHWYLAPDQGYFTAVADGGDYHAWDVPNLNAGCVAVLGAGWRVPTKTENINLAGLTSCWGAYDGQRGTSNGQYFGISSAPDIADQDNYVFFPAAGYREAYDAMTGRNTYGNYWSSEDNSNYPFSLSITSTSINGTNSNSYRNNGLSVRCVASYD